MSSHFISSIFVKSLSNLSCERQTLRSFATRAQLKMSKIDEYSADNLKKILVPVAHGSEEIETVTIIDTLVRAGCSVIVASVESSLQV